MRLEYLCDLEVGYRAAPPFVLAQPFGSREGSAYGEGDGTVTGAQLQGQMRWVNHPHARSDGTYLPDLHGILTTKDDAHVLVTMQGRTVFGPDERGEQLLQVTFRSDHESYRWLNTAFCVFEGVIRTEGRCHGRVYVCVNELV
jgi:hypothetical protein